MEKTTLKKNKEGYGYKYTELAEIHNYLEQNDMRYYQTIETSEINGCDYIMTYRFINGEWEEKAIRGCKVVDATLQGIKNPAQEQGSALTYARRYSLLMAFGLATEDDDAESLSISKEPTKEEAEQYTLSFGRYKGKTLKEIQEEKPDYIDWLLGNTKDDYIKKCIELALDKKPITEKEVELFSKMHRLIEETETDREKFYRYFKVSSDKEMTKQQIEQAIEILEQKMGE